MSKDVVACARERINDAPMETEHLIDEMIEEIEGLRRAINRINQIAVAHQPSGA